MIVYWCGFNSFKQVADVNTSEIYIPFQRIPLDDIQDIGFSWTCSLIIAGCDIYISGFCGSRSSYLKKLCKPNEGVKFSKVACGETYAIFTTDNGECWQYFYHTQCWKKLLNFCAVEENVLSAADFEYSDIANCDTTSSESLIKDRSIQDRSPKKIIKICCGDIFNVALDNRGLAYSIPSPIILPGIKVTDVACGFEHCLMLDEFGRVFSWGSGMRGQLGREVLETTDNPQEVDALGGLHVVHIAAGGWHSAAVTSSGVLYTWGWNNSGQLGFPSVESSDSTSSNDLEEEQNLDRDAKHILNYDLQSNICKNDDDTKLKVIENVEDNFIGPIEKTSSYVKNFKRIKLCTSNISIDPNFEETESENSKFNYLRLQEMKEYCVDDIKEERLHSSISSSNSKSISATKNSSLISKMSHGQKEEYVTVLAVPQAVCFPCEQDVDVVDVGCGNRHTVILTGDGSLWGCGWNAYGQLGKPPDCMISSDYLTRLDVSLTGNMKICRIHCAGWNTAVFLD